jgi:hypothetical protein
MTLDMIPKIQQIYNNDILGSIHNIYNLLSENENITIDYLLKNMNKNWDWNKLIINKGINIKDIFNNPELPWPKNWWDNPNIMPEDLINNNIYDKEKWTAVSLNLNVSIEFIIANQHLPWNWSLISRHPYLTVKIILDNQNISWDYQQITLNEMTYNPIVYTTTIKKITMNTPLIIQNLKQIIQFYI